MLDLTLRALAWVLRICMPAPSGRHRAPFALAAPTPPPPPRYTERLDGAASHLVRPYVLSAAEHEHRRRQQRDRRRALYLATLGIDVGPRPELIHGGAR
ncbi:hypothetical protein V2W30_25250 [Streptomyces sp. Q6]|uniref:Uncharacterized protein n=1 Tax=Streptomyces citrinus TaxID=3118173 RepID=A0ACD5AGL4_9ACTN